jgi:hypothetical protein
MSLGIQGSPVRINEESSPSPSRTSTKKRSPVKEIDDYIPVDLTSKLVEKNIPKSESISYYPFEPTFERSRIKQELKCDWNGLDSSESLVDEETVNHLKSSRQKYDSLVSSITGHDWNDEWRTLPLEKTLIKSKPSKYLNSSPCAERYF